MNGKILIVDDDKSSGSLLQRHFEPRGFVVSAFTSGEEAFRALAHDTFDLVLTDLKMAKIDGIELCDRIVSNYPHIPVIVITAFGSLETAVEAIRAGAYDFVTKPVDLQSLAHTIERAIRHSKLSEDVKRLAMPEGSKVWKVDDLLGDSSVMADLRSLIERAARSDVSVLISGESGTGKELVARTLHRQSSRRNKPFISVNCSTLGQSVAGKELFGYELGARATSGIGTGSSAGSMQGGALVQANGGTLLLKEVTLLPLEVQKELERALAAGAIPTQDGLHSIPIDVRIVATTVEAVEAAVAEKRFLKELAQRLSVLTVGVPALRTRENDVLVLAQHFVRQFSRRHRKDVVGIASSVAAKLLQYAWPGNIRELRNAMERAIALTTHERLVVEDLPDHVRRYRRSEVAQELEGEESFLPMDEVERKHILRVLESVDGNKLLAAKVLGVDRRTLYRKLERYGV